MTITEREIQQLKSALAVFQERLDGTREYIKVLSFQLEVLRLAQEALNEKWRDSRLASESRLAVTESQLEEFKKRWEESERRRWSVHGVMLAATLTFLANLVLLLLRK